MKKIIAVLSAVAMLLSFAACDEVGDTVSSDSSSVSSNVSDGASSEENVSSEVVSDGGSTGITDGTGPAVEYALNTANATLHGKYTEEMGGYSFTYGSAGFSVNFTGTEFWMYVPEVPMDGESVRGVGISVLVDSDMAMDATMMNVNKAGWMKLASGLSDGEHHIEVRKMSRGFFGIMASDWFVASKFGVNEGGTVQTPDPLSDLVIEVYGDSISNGDAVWLDEEGIFGTKGANHAYTSGNYTGVIGRLLDAEMRVCANTGNGLCGWVMAQDDGEISNLLPPQNCWNVIDSNHSNVPYSHEGANAADVVIINLGTNDRIELGNGDLPASQFEDEYIRFIKQIKTDCPDAIVICTIGAMGTLEGNITDQGADKGKYKVDFDRITGTTNEWADEEFCYYIELQWADTIQGGPGYDGGHPSNIAHEVYGLQFATFINERLNLGKTLPTDIPESAYSGYIDVNDPAKLGESFSSKAVATDKDADNAFDANLGTGWQLQSRTDLGEECYMGSIFQSACNISKVVITWEHATRPVEGGYRLEYTTDGESWKTLDAVKKSEDAKKNSTDTDPSYVIDTFAIDNVSAKGIRVVVLENIDYKSYAPQIFEMEITSASDFIPEGNIMEHVTGKTDNLSRVLALIGR